MRYLSFVLCLLLLPACGDSGASSGSSSSGASGSYAQSDLGGYWIGRLSPYEIGDDERLFYFQADENGNVFSAADSVGNQWDIPSSNISAALLANGNLNMSLGSLASLKKLHLTGIIKPALNEIEGEYAYENVAGIAATGHFVLVNNSAPDLFADIDFEGAWSGGFGVGHRDNERTLSFELDSDGKVISGELFNNKTLETIHSYSFGAGSFSLDDLTVGRIDNFVLVADDGSIATCDFLLVSAEGDLISGVGIDSEVGEAIIYVRR
ncbi:MAG: hypothetical protein QGF46_03200 [Planctomycetota bacterium]|jgi:hypothetical protein|nr:hypothetical protein [Planctomycetota bacterium]